VRSSSTLHTNILSALTLANLLKATFFLNKPGAIDVWAPFHVGIPIDVNIQIELDVFLEDILAAKSLNIFLLELFCAVALHAGDLNDLAFGDVCV
jgi:hypothetical protein